MSWPPSLLSLGLQALILLLFTRDEAHNLSFIQAPRFATIFREKMGRNWEKWRGCGDCGGVFCFFFWEKKTAELGTLVIIWSTLVSGNRLFLSEGQGENRLKFIVPCMFHLPCMFHDFAYLLTLLPTSALFQNSTGLEPSMCKKLGLPDLSCTQTACSGETSIGSNLPEAIGDTVHCKVPPQCFDFCG